MSFFLHLLRLDICIRQHFQLLLGTLRNLWSWSCHFLYLWWRNYWGSRRNLFSFYLICCWFLYNLNRFFILNRCWLVALNGGLIWRRITILIVWLRMHLWLWLLQIFTQILSALTRANRATTNVLRRCFLLRKNHGLLLFIRLLDLSDLLKRFDFSRLAD